MSPAGFPDLPSGWSWHELGTLCINIDDGDWIETKDQGGSDYRLLQVSNIGVGTFRETNKFRFISQSTFDRIRCTEIQPNHVLVSRMPDPIGRAWCVEVLAHRAVTAVDVAIVETDPSRLLPKYCAYYLNSPLNLRYAGSRASGTTRLRITRRDLSGFPIPVPEIKVQERIVGLLSAYDELIENNLRRIEILEEMAQAIYREWFAEFRYPGHEDVPLVDSELGPIPEGWEVTGFASAAEFINGFAFKPSHFRAEGLPIVKIKELKNGITSETPRASLSEVPAKYLLEDGDLLFSWSADLDAYLWAGGDAWLNQHLFVVRPSSDVSKLFLFHSLRNRMGEFRARSQGTTMKHIKRSALSEVHFVQPSVSEMAEFETLISPLHELILNLTKSNRNLRETRDMLLPKLISGEIDVSELDIELADSSV